MAGRGRTWRRVVLLGVPSLYVLLGLLHPTANPELGDETDLFVGLHIAQLFLIIGLGYVLWLLVEGVTNRAATLARALIIPFVVAYTALDAVLGIAWGIAAETANDLPADGPAGSGSARRRVDLRRTRTHGASSSTGEPACSGSRWRSPSWRRSGTQPRSAPSCRWPSAQRCSRSDTPHRWARPGWACSCSASHGPSSGPVRQQRRPRR